MLDNRDPFFRDLTIICGKVAFFLLLCAGLTTGLLAYFDCL